MKAPRLAEVIGQPGAVRLLARLVDRQRLPHAMILEGPPGCGRRTLALALAQALLCHHRVTAASDATHPSGTAPVLAGDACGVCVACRMMQADNHPDLVAVPNDGDAIPPEWQGLVSGEEHDISRGIPIDWMRHLADRAMQTPMSGSVRVAIVPTVERLASSAGAANALLKVLEEPPAGAYFILTAAHAGSVLPTIRSRAQVYRLQPLSREQVAEVLIRGGIAPAEARTLAAQSSGGHRGLWTAGDPPPIEALLALVQDGFSSERVAQVVEALPTRLDPGAADSGRTLPGEQRRILRQWLVALCNHLRPGLAGPNGLRHQQQIARILALRSLVDRNLPVRLVVEAIGLNQTA